MSTPPEKNVNSASLIIHNSQPHPKNLNPDPQKLPTPLEKMSPLPKKFNPSRLNPLPRIFLIPPPKILQSAPPKKFLNPPDNFATPPPPPPPDNFSASPHRKFLTPPPPPPPKTSSIVNCQVIKVSRSSV